MVHSVTWMSETSLTCTPTANVILCTTDFTIPAQLIEVFSNHCPNEFAYTFSYEDEDLPAGYLEDEGPLTDEDINQVICEDCFTQWVNESVDKAFEFVISDGTTEIILPSGGPLEFVDGAGTEFTVTDPNEVSVDVVLSTDTENQIIFGSDGNPYVPPTLYQLDGWYPISDAWTFASNTTITVPAGALLRYAKGDKLKFDNAMTKYFYVIDIADTLLTVIAGDTYTVSNSAITNIFLSKDLSPVGFPSSFAFSTILTGFAVLPQMLTRYSLLGRRVLIDVHTYGALGISNSTAFTMTAPITSEAGSVAYVSGGNQGYDNGNYQKDVLAQILTGSNLISLYPDGGTLLWTAAGDKSATFNIGYYF